MQLQGRATHLDGDLVLGEGSAPEKLVDTVNGQEAGDVSAQVAGDGHANGMSCNNLGKS